MSQIIVDHEIESLLPPLSPEKRGQLEENIKAHGCLDPLKIWRGHNVLLDGHNRFEICSRNGIPYQVSELEFGERSDALWWVIRNQFGRRDLTVFQRAELALRVEHIIKGIAKENLSAGADETNKKRWADSKSSPLQNSAKAINRRSNNKHHEVMSSDLSCDSSSVLKQDVDDHDVREDVATSCSHETQKDQPITTISPAEPTITPVDTRAELAKLAGISHDTMAKAKLISEHAPEPLKEQVRSGEVSINKAAQETKKIVHEDLEFGAPTTLPSPRKAAVPTFNKTNDNIEWAKFSWNPVTGCKHGCRYCYARDIANRFEGTFEPQFREERLSAPMNTKVPEAASRDIGYRNVFVCSMADLFGEWVPDEWIEKVMMACADSPQWNYLFLTKNPSRLPDVFFPTNAWVGTTVDTIARIQPAIEAMSKVNASVRFLSCEPMLEPLTFPTFECFDWIIIGGQSQSTGCPEFQPQWSWVSKLSLSAQEAGLKVYWKPNLRPDRPREYPVLQ